MTNLAAWDFAHANVNKTNSLSNEQNKSEAQRTKTNIGNGIRHSEEKVTLMIRFEAKK